MFLFFRSINLLQSFDLYEVNPFWIKNYQKNRRRRLIIVEKTYPPTNKNRRRRLIMKNVGDGLARPAGLDRPEKNFQNLSDIGKCSENIFVN